MLDTLFYKNADKISQKVINDSVEHHDYYIFDYDKIEVEMPNGEREYRDKISKGSAVAVICIDSSTNEIILVAQSRPVVNSITFELPAGHIDPNEYPRITAARELKEETGIEVNPTYLHELPTVYTSPGFTNERFYFYYIEVNGIKIGEQSLDNDEFIEVMKVDYDEFIDYLTTTDDIVDGKTSIGVLCYDRYMRTLDDIQHLRR